MSEEFHYAIAAMWPKHGTLSFYMVHSREIFFGDIESAEAKLKYVHQQVANDYKRHPRKDWQPKAKDFSIRKIHFEIVEIDRS